jgi:hypothetical protein
MLTIETIENVLKVSPQLAAQTKVNHRGRWFTTRSPLRKRGLKFFGVTTATVVTRASGGVALRGADCA